MADGRNGNMSTVCYAVVWTKLLQVASCNTLPRAVLDGPSGTCHLGIGGANDGRICTLYKVPSGEYP